jgi:hypothetical protein
MVNGVADTVVLVLHVQHGCVMRCQAAARAATEEWQAPTHVIVSCVTIEVAATAGIYNCVSLYSGNRPWPAQLLLSQLLTPA